LGIISSVIGLFLHTTSYSKTFDIDDWEKIDDGFSINISSKDHGMGKSPHIDFFVFENNKYLEETACSEHDTEGNVRISANSKLKGKYVITR
jgi:hypothetical protein